ncbi:hypothetical protein Tco_0296533 [Tanacetum coccineum]
MFTKDNFSLHDDEELSLYDDASLDGSVPASNKGDAPAKPPQIITTNTLSNIKLPNGNSKKRVTKGKDGVYWFFLQPTQGSTTFHGMDDAKEDWGQPFKDRISLEKGMRGSKNSITVGCLGAGVSDMRCKFSQVFDGPFSAMG